MKWPYLSCYAGESNYTNTESLRLEGSSGRQPSSPLSPPFLFWGGSPGTQDLDLMILVGPYDKAEL